MGKKKLIVIWPYRFRDFDWQRFELDYLAPHVEIHVHELIDALTPEFGAAYANQSENPAVKRFASLKEWRKEFKKISEDAVIFNHVRPINLKSILICATLRRSRASVVGFSKAISFSTCVNPFETSKMIGINIQMRDRIIVIKYDLCSSIAN